MPLSRHLHLDSCTFRVSFLTPDSFILERCQSEDLFRLTFRHVLWIWKKFNCLFIDTSKTEKWNFQGMQCKEVRKEQIPFLLKEAKQGWKNVKKKRSMYKSCQWKSKHHRFLQKSKKWIIVEETDSLSTNFLSCLPSVDMFRSKIRLLKKRFVLVGNLRKMISLRWHRKKEQKLRK